MPCDGSYMNPTHEELNGSRALTLLDELDGKPFDRHNWSGYHPKAYNHALRGPEFHASVATLCQRLQSTDVSKYSLELQMWWRDHLVADRKRAEQSLKDATTDAQRRAAIAKLTPHERRLLGLPAGERP